MQEVIASFSSTKINAAVLTTNTVGSTPVALYTSPSNGYAILQVYVTGAVLNLRVAGVTIFQATMGSSGSQSNQPAVPAASMTSGFLGQIFVGPGQVVSAVATSGGSIVNLSGVSFVNSP